MRKGDKDYQRLIHIIKYSNFPHPKVLESSLLSVVIGNIEQVAEPSPMGKVASEASRMRFHCMMLYVKRNAVNLTHRFAVPPPQRGGHRTVPVYYFDSSYPAFYKRFPFLSVWEV